MDIPTSGTFFSIYVILRAICTAKRCYITRQLRIGICNLCTKSNKIVFTQSLRHLLEFHVITASNIGSEKVNIILSRRRGLFLGHQDRMGLEHFNKRQNR